MVHDKKLYVANAGDCKGVLCSEEPNGNIRLTKINQKFNANSRKEQARLKAQFTDRDIVTKRNAGAFYVKVTLGLRI